MSDMMVLNYAIALRVYAPDYVDAPAFAIFENDLPFLQWIQRRAAIFTAMYKKDRELLYFDYFDSSIAVLNRDELTEDIADAVDNAGGNPVYVPHLAVPYEGYVERTEVEILKMDYRTIHWHFRLRHVDAEIETSHVSYTELAELLSPVQHLIDLHREEAERAKAGQNTT